MKLKQSLVIVFLSSVLLAEKICIPICLLFLLITHGYPRTRTLMLVIPVVSIVIFLITHLLVPISLDYRVFPDVAIHTSEFSIVSFMKSNLCTTTTSEIRQIFFDVINNVYVFLRGSELDR
jgi:hypothetical protein